MVTGFGAFLSFLTRKPQNVREVGTSFFVKLCFPKTHAHFHVHFGGSAKKRPFFRTGDLDWPGLTKFLFLGPPNF